jgi:hypothetical protein
MRGLIRDPQLSAELKALPSRKPSMLVTGIALVAILGYITVMAYLANMLAT